MKPSADNRLEHWRHDDTGLRRALQQRYADQPQLPEGFTERMMAALPSDLSSAPRPNKQRRLWPFASATLAAAALLTAVFFILREPKQQLMSETPEQATAEISAAASDESSTLSSLPPTKSIAQSTKMPKELLTKSAPAIVSETEASEIEPSETEASETTTEATDDKPNTDQTTIEVAGDKVTTDRPATEDFTLTAERLKDLTAQEDSHGDNHLGSINQRFRGKQKSASPAEPLIAMSVHFGTNGSVSDYGNRDWAYNDYVANTNHNFNSNILDPEVRSKSSNYYFLVGEGYTYDFGEYDTYKSSDGSTPSPKRQTLTYEQPISNTKHHMPFTAGATVEWTFAKGWALESGLTYTRLASTFERGTTASVVQQEQRIHYLGIPIRVHASLFDHKRWNGYGAAGGSIELPLAAALNSRLITPGQDRSLSSSHIKAPVQGSLSAGVGVQFKLTPHIGIYVEPSLQWFIPSDNDVKTYRTEHPLQFVPAFGLRWHL